MTNRPTPNGLTQEERDKLSVFAGGNEAWEEFSVGGAERAYLFPNKEYVPADEWRPDEDDAQWAMVLDAARENGYLTQIIDGANEACEVFMWHGKANRHACKIASNRRLATCRAVLAMLAEAKESENGVR